MRRSGNEVFRGLEIYGIVRICNIFTNNKAASCEQTWGELFIAFSSLIQTDLKAILHLFNKTFAKP